jgi:spore coat polysaccharide biosynthesis protein SpsF
MPLAGHTLLSYLIDRLKAATSLDSVAIATTRNAQDDILEAQASILGVPCFRGSENDVLSRYLRAARAFRSDIVVRVTADNPLTDPASIDRVVARVRDGQDYAIEDNMPIGTTGEAVTFQALRFLDISATTPRLREHVTLYAKENPQLFRYTRYAAPADCARPDLSFTVDTPADYMRIKDLCARIPSPQFPLKDVILLADKTVVV